MNYEQDRSPQARWHELERDGTHLACADFGGSGRPVLLLHGLAGHATEWNETASWLTANHRVLAPDLRGHGRSEREPQDVSRDAHVADVAAWINHFGDQSVALVGQSLGGHTAFLVAASHPELVNKLVVVEAGPGPSNSAQDESAKNEALSRVRQWLMSWPVPFPSRETAIAYFGQNDNWARAWADGLEERNDGFHPSFDIDVMVKTLEAASGSYWNEWRSIKCPVLLVVAKNRENLDLAHRMIEAQPSASLVEISEAGHDLHLDNSTAWRSALERFLESSDSQDRTARAGRGRNPCTEMAADELVRLLDALNAAEVAVWVDGGWGVDALFCEQRRQHDDLDVVVGMEDVSTLQRVLKELGYTFQRREAPLSFELVDPDGRQVDVHPVKFNDRGDGIYQMDNGKTWTYPAQGLAGTGRIGGHQVRCLTPELQMRVHSGYALTDKDHEEVRALHERFGVSPPPGYKPSE